ncbi:hypothetical protein BV25DRAFT_1547648 [Artomyces pyxidatus]|uniref:Uncharacterized protein n=1 Tax=Artomyces pyxidatus TaxID=48021 RepID=A0ACB8SLH5_9AGAM|nr:hypothetical protein BV25DRAFT_1547648 [Artomyces pyxidatus]
MTVLSSAISSNPLAMEMSTQEVQGDIKNIAKLSLSNTEAALAVSRLPPEILCQIFLCYRSLEPSQFTIRVNGEASIGGEQSSSHGDEERGWINITYICSRWREIAIGYPALWDCVGPFIPAQWQDEILRRSSQHPLSITLEVNRLDRTELNGLIDKALPRLRHLSLDWVDTALDYNANQRLPLTGNQFSEFLDQFSTASICAPVLDSLSLCYPVDCQTVNLSAASLPALRSLDLTCFGVEPTCSGLNNITDLTIDTYRMTTEELYIALQHMPKLEDLYATLRYVGGFGDFLPPEYLPVALPMPHLKSLQVKAFHPECFELFRHLDIPADSCCSSISLSRHFAGRMGVAFPDGCSRRAYQSPGQVSFVVNNAPASIQRNSTMERVVPRRIDASERTAQPRPHLD